MRSLALLILLFATFYPVFKALVFVYTSFGLFPLLVMIPLAYTTWFFLMLITFVIAIRSFDAPIFQGNAVTIPTCKLVTWVTLSKKKPWTLID